MSEVWQQALTWGASDIAARIPHAGSMSLLKGVRAASAHSLLAWADSHRCLDNPLRLHGRLGAACGVEYAAQAMALHGALTQMGTEPGDSQEDAPSGGEAAVRGGYLVNVRDLQLHVPRLDELASDLLVQINQVDASGAFSIYTFSLCADAQQPEALLAGTAYVLLQAPATGVVHG